MIEFKTTRHVILREVEETLLDQIFSYITIDQDFERKIVPCVRRFEDGSIFRLMQAARYSVL